MTRTGTKTRRRSDSDIFIEARHALDQCANVPATVRVHVDEGTVTLTGTARLPSERAEAAHVVRDVAGVQRIVNHITVTQVVSAEGFEPPEDRR